MYFVPLLCVSVSSRCCSELVGFSGGNGKEVGGVDERVSQSMVAGVRVWLAVLVRGDMELSSTVSCCCGEGWWWIR